MRCETLSSVKRSTRSARRSTDSIRLMATLSARRLILEAKTMPIGSATEAAAIADAIGRTLFSFTIRHHRIVKGAIALPGLWV